MSFLYTKQKILNIIGRNSANGKNAFILSYFHNRWRFPNLKHPKNISEIWIKRVLDGKVNELFFLADKYAVRDYVVSKGLESILIPLIGVYESADDINFDALPNRFALKANYGAGRNIICVDKLNLNFEQCRKQVRTWLQPEQYSVAERHYDLIPKKFICEEFIDDGMGGFPVDYKFMCINGKVHCILGVSGRETGEGTYLPYSLDWQPIPNYFRGHLKSYTILPKPSNLCEMIHIAERLADGIDLVRIDLYSNGTQIWFGEITLTPDGCILRRWSNKAISNMGKEYRKTMKK